MIPASELDRMGGEARGRPLPSFLQFLEWRRQERAELVCGGGGGKVWDEAVFLSQGGPYWSQGGYQMCVKLHFTLVVACHFFATSSV